MTNMIAASVVVSHPKPVILAIFAITYLGVAAGRVPGLKLNRVGIALLGANGFPALSVPAGFTTEVYDRVPDKDAEGGTRMIGPIAAKLPVNVDFLGKPFDEATLFRIAGAYEAATRHRQAPAGFGPVKK